MLYHVLRIILLFCSVAKTTYSSHENMIIMMNKTFEESVRNPGKEHTKANKESLLRDKVCFIVMHDTISTNNNNNNNKNTSNKHTSSLSKSMELLRRQAVESFISPPQNVKVDWDQSQRKYSKVFARNSVERNKKYL